MPTDLPPPLLIGLPLLSGLCFSVIGVCYRLAGHRGLLPTHVMLCMAAGGSLLFGAQLLGDSVMEAPILVWALGVASGLAQWGCIHLISLALRMGPLSPMWCALNLPFVMVIAYSWFLLGESVSLPAAVGVGLAIFTVVIGSLGQRQGATKSGDRRGGWGQVLSYALLLIGLLLSNSLMHVAIKILGSVESEAGSTLMVDHGNLFFLLLYLGIGLPLGIGMLLKRDGRMLSPVTWRLGVVAAGGSIGGVWLLGVCSAEPGADAFTLSGVMSILGAATISVIRFGERADLLWWIMMTSAISSVVLISL